MYIAPKGLRIHIGIFGRRNVGKSSLLNAITRQQIAIVSPIAGTTTDPVEKPMELLPLGPVLFIDTAGIDDVEQLGALRIGKTKQVFDRTDIGVIVSEANAWGPFEQQILQQLLQRKVPVIVVLNKIDLLPINQNLIKDIEQQAAIPIQIVFTSTANKIGILDFRQALLNSVPDEIINKQIIANDLVAPGECVVLVTPIDKEAPKGRLILPEVQTIRNLLDGNAYCLITKETELKTALQQLKKPAKLVITDSSCFAAANAITPTHIPLTSFSILYSRLKGDLISQTIATLAIDKLTFGDNILICEACTHHPIEQDIGRVQIPKLLNKYTSSKLNFHTVQGLDFPDDLTNYKLIIHCGACMFNRKTLLNRILQAQKAGVPLTNYGLAIAHCLGILPRALQPFPAASQAYHHGK